MGRPLGPAFVLAAFVRLDRAMCEALPRRGIPLFQVIGHLVEEAAASSPSSGLSENLLRDLNITQETFIYSSTLHKTFRENLFHNQLLALRTNTDPPGGSARVQLSSMATSEHCTTEDAASIRLFLHLTSDCGIADKCKMLWSRPCPGEDVARWMCLQGIATKNLTMLKTKQNK